LPYQPQSRKKQLLVMDEVDGMSGGDRGGTQELITLIKKSKVCNIPLSFFFFFLFFVIAFF
jgi:hypothetical protein